MEKVRHSAALYNRQLVDSLRSKGNRCSCIITVIEINESQVVIDTLLWLLQRGTVGGILTKTKCLHDLSYQSNLTFHSLF